MLSKQNSGDQDVNEVWEKEGVKQVRRDLLSYIMSVELAFEEK